MTARSQASAPAAVKGLTPPSRQPGPKPRIGDMIVQLGFADSGTIEHGLARARETGLPLGQALVADGMVTPDQLARALAERNALEHVDLNVFDVDMGAANLIDPGEGAPLPGGADRLRRPRARCWSRSPTRPTCSRSTTSAWRPATRCAAPSPRRPTSRR